MLYACTYFPVSSPHLSILISMVVYTIEVTCMIKQFAASCLDT